MMPATIDARRLLLDEDLAASHQVRFTASQDELLRELTRNSRRPISATIRDIVVAWAVDQVLDEDWLRDEPPSIDLYALGDDLARLGRLESRIEAQ